MKVWELIQVVAMFQWVKDRAGFEPSFRVICYAAEYNRRMLGIFPWGDPISYIPLAEVRTETAAASPSSYLQLPALATAYHPDAQL